LISKGWIVLSATGQTAYGQPINIRSLFYALHQGLLPLQSGDLFEGVHHTVIQIGEFVEVYWGEFAGTLVGRLVPSGIEGTIRLSGSGDFHLSGERVLEASPSDFPITIPLEDPDLPAAFLQAIAGFFDLPFVQELQDI
jgi:hypothetical protein